MPTESKSESTTRLKSESTAEREQAKTFEDAIKDADAPDLVTGRILSSDERRLFSMTDEKKLSKEDKDALAQDARVIRMVSFTTMYAVEAASDEAAIEAVKRDSSKFPFSEPTVTVQSRSALGLAQFLTGKDYETRAKARDKSETERRERAAKETAAARQSSANALTHTHPAPLTGPVK